MKAFRNNGLEGGYGSLRTQNWLLGLRRSLQRHEKLTGEKVNHMHRTGHGSGPPVKVLPKVFTFPHNSKKLHALLLEYAEQTRPIQLGSRSNREMLIKAGLLWQTKKYDREASDVSFGGAFKLTKKGREYVALLKS